MKYLLIESNRWKSLLRKKSCSYKLSMSFLIIMNRNCSWHFASLWIFFNDFLYLRSLKKLLQTNPSWCWLILKESAKEGDLNFETFPLPSLKDIKAVLSLCSRAIETTNRIRKTWKFNLKSLWMHNFILIHIHNCEQLHTKKSKKDEEHINIH